MQKRFSTALLTIILLQFCFISPITAQENKEKKQWLEKISLTPQIGLLHSWGDFREDGLFPGFLDLDRNKVGANLLLNYRISKVFSISGGILTGELEGRQNSINTTGARNEPRDLGKGIYFNTNILEVTLPRIDVSLTRLIFKDKVKLFEKLSLNLIASHGLVYFDSKIYSIQDDVNLLYGKKRGRTGKTTEAVTSLGMGLTYRLNDRFDLGIESTIRNVWNDKLDAWVTPGSADDKYSFTAIGISYHLKKRKEKIEEFIEEQPTFLAEEGADIIEDEGPKTVIENQTTITDSTDLVDLPNADKETVFGIYTYEKLPAINKGIVVLDENGFPIDTIYTDDQGKFNYTKLNSDDQISFVPLDAEDIDMNEIALVLTSNKNNESIQMVYNEAQGRFVKYQKLLMQIDTSVVEPELEFREIDLDEETVFGYYVYDKLPMADKALIVMDENGFPLDTFYTDTDGKFEFSKLGLDSKTTLVPLGMNNKDMELVELYVTNKDGKKKQLMSKASRGFVFKTPVVTKTPKVKTPAPAATVEKEGVSISEGGGNFIVVAAFRGLQGSKRKVDELSQKGIKSIVVRNTRDTWYWIALDRYDEKEVALQKMREARAKGFEKAWVGIK